MLELKKIQHPISGMQCKITKYAKKQDNMTQNEEENPSIQTDPEMTEMLELVDKENEMVFITVFRMFKKLKDEENMLLHKHGIYFFLKEPNQMSRYKNYNGAGGNFFRGDGYIHYLACSDGFMGVDMSKLTKLYT